MKHERRDRATNKSHKITLDMMVPLAASEKYLKLLPPLLRPTQFKQAVINPGALHYIPPQPGTRRHAALQLPGGLKDAKR